MVDLSKKFSWSTDIYFNRTYLGHLIFSIETLRIIRERSRQSEELAW